MVRLQPHAQHAALAHRVAAARDVANLRRRQHQVLVAHQLGHGGGDLRRDGPAQRRAAPPRPWRRRSSNSRNSPTVRPPIGRNASSSQRLAISRLTSSSSGSSGLRRRSSLSGTSARARLAATRSRSLPARDAGQPVARFLLVRLGQHLAQPRKRKSLRHLSPPVSYAQIISLRLRIRSSRSLIPRCSRQSAACKRLPSNPTIRPAHTSS